MNKDKYIELVKISDCVLDLERKIIGVRFLFTKDDFNSSNAPQPKGRLPYCKMINQATEGMSLKVNIDNFGCFAAARVLGIVEMDDWYTSGHYYGISGLYQDMPTSKNITENMSNCNHKSYGIEIMPLEEFDNEPHIVIIATNTQNVMRVIQGHAYKYGTHKGYKFVGSQAMCGECTAHPYITNDINISLLCEGTRKSGFNKDEVGIGIPFRKFVEVVDGICQTVTPVESNLRKKSIEEKMVKHDVDGINIVYNKNYGYEMHKYDFNHFLKKDKS